MKNQPKCLKTLVKQPAALALWLCITVCIVSFGAASPSQSWAAAHRAATPTPTPKPLIGSFSLSSASQVKPADVILEMSYGGGGIGNHSWICGNVSSKPYIPAGIPHTVIRYASIEPMETIEIAACGWKTNEKIELTISKPDGKRISVQLTSQSQSSNIYYAKYSLTPQLNEKTGEYSYRFQGSSGAVSSRFTVYKPSGARLYWLTSSQMMLYQFKANERVRVFAYKAYGTAWKFLAWQEFTTNARGELLITDSLNADDYVVVGSKSGEVHFRNPYAKWNHRDTETTGAYLITKAAANARVCFNPPATRLKPGNKASVANTVKNPLDVRKEPSKSGEVVGKLPKGTVITILDGPVCSNEMYWWHIRLSSGVEGYVAEGDSRQYFLEPMNASFSLQNASMVPPADVLQEVSYSGGAGDKCLAGSYPTNPEPAVNVCTSGDNDTTEPFGLARFWVGGLQKGDVTKVVITFPNGKQVPQTYTADQPTYSGKEVGFTFDYIPRPGDPAGIYIFTFNTPRGVVKQTITVIIPDHADLYIDTEQHKLYFLGFKPGENVRLFLYEKSSGGVHFKAWQTYVMDQEGGLVVEYPSQIEPLFVAVGEISGEAPFLKVGAQGHTQVWDGGDIYCLGAPPPLGLQDGVEVIVVADTVTVKEYPWGVVLSVLPRGDIEEIIYSPWQPECYEGSFWWKVGENSWIPEGKGDKYFIQEYNPDASDPVAGQPGVTPTWPVSETGVEACHIAAGMSVRAGKDARLWSKPDVGTGSILKTLTSNTLIKVISGPIWGKARANPDYFGWWWQVEAEGISGWLYQIRIIECGGS